MSMIGNLTRIPENVRVKLLSEPELIQDMLYPEFIEAPIKKPGLLSKLFGKKGVEENLPSNVIYEVPEDDTTDIDRTWHVLHFLFTGSDIEGPFPNGFLLSCGEPIGDEDVGYGSAKSFNPDQVKEISDYLLSLDKAELKGKMDLQEMSRLEIYPNFWSEGADADEEWPYFEGGFDTASEFVKATAERNMALLVYIN